MRWALMFCARRWAADGGFFERARARERKRKRKRGTLGGLCTLIDAIEYKHVVADWDGRRFNLIWVMCPLAVTCFFS